MDPATIVTTVMAVLTPFVKRGVAEFGRAAGQAACDKAEQLLQFVKGKLAGDPAAASNLEKFEKKPEVYQPVIEDVLKEKVAAEPAFAAELETRAKDLGPVIVIIQEMEKGERVVGLNADEMKSGSVSVTQPIKEGTDITGARIGRIG